MKIVGLTGGIGSGKSTVARFFAEMGIPVYNADIEAKKVVVQPEVKQQIINLLGKESFSDGDVYNTSYVANLVFNDTNLLSGLNSIIHPAVAVHFEEWLKNQNTLYVIKEAAILFESGSYQLCDKVILVVAPKKARIERVSKRDTISQQEVISRIKFQWSDAQKRKMSDYVINNSGTLQDLKAQVFSLHTLLTNTFL